MDDSRYSRYLPKTPREWAAVTAACVGLVWLFGDDLWLQFQRTRAKLRDSVRENVSIELEIERARTTAASLIPDIRRNHEIIVREQVEIEELRDEIQQEQKGISRQREEIVGLRSRLPSAESPSAIEPNSRIELRKDLQRRFAIFQEAEATFCAKLQILHSRQESLAKAESAHNEILGKKSLLEAQVTNLETRLKLLETTGIENRVRVDREKLTQCEELIRYLRRRLAIAERLTRSMPGANETRSAELEQADDDIEHEIDGYLARGTEPMK